jgi:hypothetical protein
LPLPLVLVACNTPGPRPWLRFQQQGPTNWTATSEGVYGARLHGTDVTLDLNKTQTRVEIKVVNSTTESVEFRMGESASLRNSIGEVLLRQIDGPPNDGPPIRPYNSMQPIAVEAGWRGTFYLDTPLGRDAMLGQFFVLTLEARNSKGGVERRTLPLVAANAGTLPAGGN